VTLEDSISVKEAAQALGVNERAVRFMVRAGTIDGTKRGNAWWLDRRSVERRRREQRGAGRLLSPGMAWSVLLLASGDERKPAAFERHHRSRARRWLAANSLATESPRLAARARRESFAAHPSELKRIEARPDTMRTGISAAPLVGLHGTTGEIEAYAPAGDRTEMVQEHALEPARGSILLRWVPDELWPAISGDLAPRAAALVDLLEHDDPRARREAAAALRRL
jgi:excisionase family DNA binding protein